MNSIRATGGKEIQGDRLSSFAAKAYAAGVMPLRALLLALLPGLVAASSAWAADCCSTYTPPMPSYSGPLPSLPAYHGPLPSQPAPVSCASVGLVGWWKFDETSGTVAVDSSGNGNTGTLVNNPTWGGGVLQFNGTNYVLTSYTTPIGTSGFTYSVWFKTSTSQFGGLVAKRRTGSNYVQFSLYMSGSISGNIGTNIAFNDRDVTGEMHAGISTHTYTDNNWHNAVLVRTKTTASLYVDNQLEASSSGSAVNLTPEDPIMIGNLGDAGAPLAGTYFNGLIDDIRIYNRALSAAEVKQLYDSTGP